ncbi:hypothetical protein [Natronomonas sp. EA1]
MSRKLREPENESTVRAVRVQTGPQWLSNIKRKLGKRLVTDDE